MFRVTPLPSRSGEYARSPDFSSRWHRAAQGAGFRSVQAAHTVQLAVSRKSPPGPGSNLILPAVRPLRAD
jgi:hypothetical protein